MASKPLGNKFSSLIKRGGVSRIHLAVFILAFGLIGYLIFKSFAAAPLVTSLEAEQMILPAGGNVITDSVASGGKAVKLTVNGAGSGSVSFPSSVSSFTVNAYGSQCSGSPYMAVALDGTTYLPATAISSTAWTSYSATPAATIASGTHTLTITASNLGVTQHGNSKKNCDRSLYIDVTNFYGPVAVTTPAPTVTISASPASVTAGMASTLTWASTNASSCSAAGAWSGTEPASGSISTGALNQTSTYSLTCTGAGGSAIASTTVTVTSPTANSSFGTSLPAPLPQSSGIQLSGSSTSSLSTLFSGLNAGTTLCLHGGTYGQSLTSAVTLSASGTATNPITIESCPGETAQIAQLIEVTGSYIRLTNLKFIRNSYPTDTRYGQSGSSPGGNVGIWLKGPHITLEKSELTGTTMSCIFGGGSYDQILANYVHDCGTTPDDHGIYYTSDHSLIANNVFYRNYDFGIQLGYSGAFNDIVANNTTVYNGLVDPTHPGSGTVTFSGTANNIFVNNIASYNGQYGYKTYDTTNSLSHDDAYSNPSGATSGSFSLVTSLYATNPMFVSSTDFHLQSGSPMISAGDAAYTPQTDFYGNTRSTADLGAIAH